MATIVMESAKVIEAAKKAIADIRAERMTQDNDKIYRRMNDRAFSLFRGFYKMTTEEAIVWLDDRHSWGWRSIYGWKTFEHAKNLLRLAQHGDPVTLNEKDTAVLF